MQYRNGTIHHNNLFNVHDEHKTLIMKNNHMHSILQCEENDISVPVQVTKKLLT
jgi:hypothetical protein